MYKIDRSIFFVFIFFFLLCHNIDGQNDSIYNLDFENWVDSTMRNISLPFSEDTIVENPKHGLLRGWSDWGNSLRTTDSYCGKYALILYNWYGTGDDYAVLGEHGNPKRGCVNCGTAINFKPKTVSFAYKGELYQGTETDSLHVFVNVILTKYDSSHSRRDTIGQGSIKLDKTGQKYEVYEFDILYDRDLIPDTIILKLSFKGYKIKGGKCVSCIFLYFDDFKLHHSSTSNEKHGFNESIQLYPNPVDDILTLKNESNKILTFQILDICGTLMGDFILMPKVEFDYSMANLDTGLYFFVTQNNAYKIFKN